MGLINIKTTNYNIPIFDILTVSAGFYIGYLNGKGIESSLDSINKYGPVIFATTLSFSSCKLSRFIFQKTINVIKNNQNEDFLKNQDKLQNLENRLENLNCLKPTLKNASITAVETSLSYLAGRVVSQYI